MAISFTRYVDITSGVGGAALLSPRELILRLFTTNIIIPTNSVVEFDDADDVGVYFGSTTGDEFLQAQFYFGFISKLSTTPPKISFARWADVAVVPTVFGATGTYATEDFNSIADGAMTVTMGPDTEILTGMNFTAVASLNDVAGVIQAALIATAASVQFTGAVVGFNPGLKAFVLTGGGPAGDAAMVIAPGGSGTEIAPLVGWVAPDGRFSEGSAAQTVTTVLTESAELTNNFGSFAFIPTQDAAQVLEAANWNDGENVRFMYCQKVLAVDAATLSASIIGVSGTALTLYDDTLVPLEYPWLVPAAIFAATPYQRRASVQNYMFQPGFALTASVSTNALADTYDALRVNYWGVTQQAGTLLAFYQRGFLMGGSADPIDMGVYCNEVFLKDAVGVSIINLLLALSAVSANATGKAQVLAQVQANIDDAIFSGIITIGKTLNSTQIAFITSVTGDPQAFLQIQSLGYWITASIEEPTANEFEVQYILLYSKNDVVRKVEGSHILI